MAMDYRCSMDFMALDSLFPRDHSCLSGGRKQAPIDTIPDELLMSIFEMVRDITREAHYIAEFLPGEGGHITPQEKMLRTMSDLPALLGSVQRSWRQILRATPGLWLWCAITRHPQPEKLSRFAQYSGNRKIALCLFAPRSDWHMLHVDAYHIVRQMPEKFFEVYTNLHSAFVWPTIITTSITVLSVDHAIFFSAHDLRNLLASCPNLVRFFWGKGVYCQERLDDEEPLAPIRMGALKQMSFKATCFHVLVENFTFPVLELVQVEGGALTWPFWFNGIPRAAVDFACKQSTFPSIRTLLIKSIDVPGDPQALLEAMPTVQTLVFVDCHVNYVSCLRHSWLAAHMETLVLDGMWDHIIRPPAVVDDILRERRRWSLQSKQGKMISKLVLWKGLFINDIITLVRYIHEWRRMGMEVYIA